MSSVLKFKRTYPSYHCPYCGKNIGYIGRFFSWLFGTRIHKCNFSNVKPTEELEVEPKKE